ncbi:hypothetical protein M408DRAFT_328738 [Serendipita vermifera MAFF 305830]|uniref:Vacuolar protein 14 C-terminal Fig4-binding domain-containing protein n=1 Tax=Serendipita vermifera MAFF 305830 TaxID=933852 RepID=A0A0C2XKB0_SERVB|nr:hypothetical protein M408DRAFT_328738 [Serendipita vermifera MAFF 305830]
MDPVITKGLHDKFYEKRKAAALDLEKLVRDCHFNNEQARIDTILDQVTELFANASHPLHVRNGGLIALAAVGIALGTDIAPYMEKFVKPLLVCFSDNESRIRYFAAESMYNIAKVSRGEILIYFNPIFDALSKLSADSELSVKNGAELLDRLLKDTVAECATVYIAQIPQSEKARERVEEAYGLGILVNHPDDNSETKGLKKAFSLANFIPLLADRIYVLSPFTRSFLISWIGVLDSVPDLEMVSYLPQFLDGLLKYLSDPTEEVTTAAENLLADFLREIRDIAAVNKKRQERMEAKRIADRLERERFAIVNNRQAESGTMTESAAPQATDAGAVTTSNPTKEKQELEKIEERDTGVWQPGQGVKVDHAAIVEILINQLDEEHDEIQQSIALKWLHEFLSFAQDVVVPFTPRLIPAVLPNLAHHAPDIQAAAIKLNQSLFSVIQNLPSTSPMQSGSGPSQTLVVPVRNASVTTPSPARGGIPIPNATNGNLVLPSTSPQQSSPIMSRPPLLTDGPDINSLPKLRPVHPIPEQPTGGVSSNSSFVDKEGAASSSRPGSPQPDPEKKSTAPANEIAEEADPFDYHTTVGALTVRFLSEHEDTRVAALKWLIMLHQKVPNKILAMDDGTFPALLKNLSDSSEEVIKYDLQLLARISTNSDESYFKSFMINLLGLFSTDKRLLETRGSLIIRQLCISLNTERIYRTLAEILEKEEDLAFASNMVQKLNLILITSPELAESRKRLKTLETRQDGQALFITLYRSWCHNAVAAFSLCLLAQAYEHAANLLQIFAELEITVHLLVQIDKLVQLIESPVFTYLRLQLLEPEKFPHLYKCLYGLLMLLPQSPAFISLRNRLNAVSSLGFLHIAPKPSTVNVVANSRSKMARDEIKWQDLFAHFRSVQAKHEKARRVGLGGSPGPLLDGYSVPSGSGSSGRPPARRRVTGDAQPPPHPAGVPASAQLNSRGTGALSPLNPRARSGAGNALMGALGGGSRPMSPNSMLAQQRGKRAMSITRK